MIEFTVHGNPVPKQRPRLGRRNTTYTPQRTKNWEAEVGWICKQNNPGLVPLQGEVAVWMVFYRKNRRRADLTNMVKAIEDGLNGVAYVDDNQIVESHTWKRIDKDDPRVEVKVKPI